MITDALMDSLEAECLQHRSNSGRCKKEKDTTSSTRVVRGRGRIQLKETDIRQEIQSHQHRNK